jgi:DNA-binding protein HU-beta
MAKRRSKVGRAEIIEAVQKKLESSKVVAKQAVVAVFTSVSEALAQEGEAQILGFGLFRVRTRPARTGRNPRTGKALPIGKSSTVRFRAGRTLKAAIKAK